MHHNHRLVLRSYLHQYGSVAGLWSVRCFCHSRHNAILISLSAADVECQREEGSGRIFPDFIEVINNYPFDQKKPLLAIVCLVIVVGIGAYIVGGDRKSVV